MLGTPALVVCLAGLVGLWFRQETPVRVRTTDRDGSSAVTTRDTDAAGTTTTPPTTVATGPDGSTGLLASSAIASYLEGRDGDITAAVYDLETGQLSQWRPGVAEDTASIVKVDILATLLHQLAQTDTDLDSEQQYLAETMIEDSSNDSATSLWDEVGQNEAVASFDKLVGMTGTTPGTDGYWGLTTTTADDQVRLLEKLVEPNDVLDAASRSYELGLMEDVESSEHWGVSSGPDGADGTTIALKNGWLPQEGDSDWQINSIGWVHGDGRDYLIAVLTAGNDTMDYGVDTIEGLSSLVWSELGS